MSRSRALLLLPLLLSLANGCGKPADAPMPAPTPERGGTPGPGTTPDDTPKTVSPRVSIDPKFKPGEGLGPASIQNISLSIDGKRVAFCTQGLARPGVAQPENAQVWQVEGPKQLAAFVNPDDRRAWITLTSKGDKALFYSSGGVTARSLDDGKEELTVPCGGQPDVKFSHTDGQVGFTSLKGLEVWNITPVKNLLTQEHNNSWPALSNFFDGGSKIATAEKGIVTIWDVTAKKATGTMDTKNAKAAVSGFYNGRLSFSANGKLVAAHPVLDSLKVWESATGKVVHEVSEASLPRFGQLPVFSPDGRTLVLGQRDGSILLLDTSLGKRMRS